MKRKHLILLATPLLIIAILYAWRYAVVLRSDAEHARVLTELQSRLTVGMPEAEVRAHLKELGLAAGRAYDATGLGLEHIMVVDHPGYRDALDLWSYMLDSRLAPTANSHFVIALTANGYFVSID